MADNEKAPQIIGSQNNFPNNIIPPNKAESQEIQDFLTNDFLKSGISEETIEKYKDGGYLTSTSGGWQLYYPELLANTKSDYYTKRFKNPIDKRKYIRPTGEVSKLFRPLDFAPENLQSPVGYLVITEGEKKAIKAVQEGFNCLSVAGVWCWKQDPKNETEHEHECDIIPDLKELNLAGKTIYLCYDADLWEKEQVRSALYAFACYLISEKKAKVKIITLPQGKAKGLDDYLIAEGKENFQKFMDEAKEYSLKDIQDILSGNNKKLSFPINVFRDDVRDLIIDLQKRLDAPLEYIATIFITGASVLMDGKFLIVVDKNKGWIDYPIVWSAIIGVPSQKKTPCFEVFKRIINEFQEQLNQKYNDETEKYCKTRIDYKMALKQYEKQTPTDETVPMPENPKEPCKEILTAQSITVEALTKAISRNNGRSLAIWVDELSSLLKGMGQYKSKGGNDLEYFLQAWKKQSYTVLRSNQENSYTILASHNIIGGIQPKELSKTLFNNKFESSNGMIERWLYACSDYEETGEEYQSDRPYSVSLIKTIYERLFCTENEIQCYFSPDAQATFNAFCKFIVGTKKTNITDLMKSYIQKQTDYVARFSLILHCINDASSNEISCQTVKDAIALSKYFVGCFEKISQQNYDYNPLEAQTLDYLRIKKLKSISPSKLYKSNTSRYRTSESAKIILEILATKGHGRLQRTKNGGINFIYYT